MVNRNDKTNTGEGDRGKKGRTVSDDVGGKSLSDTSTSVGVKSTVILTSMNIFETSNRDKSQYFVDKVKDKRRKKNNDLEFLIGWRGFPDPNFHYPNDLDRSLNEVVTDKIRKYPSDYNNNPPTGISFIPTVVSHLCILFPVRLGDYIVNLWTFYFCKLIGKLTVFFLESGVQLVYSSSGQFHNHRVTFYFQLKSKIDSISHKRWRVGETKDK